MHRLRKWITRICGNAARSAWRWCRPSRTRSTSSCRPCATSSTARQGPKFSTGRSSERENPSGAGRECDAQGDRRPARERAARSGCHRAGERDRRRGQPRPVDGQGVRERAGRPRRTRPGAGGSPAGAPVHPAPAGPPARPARNAGDPVLPRRLDRARRARRGAPATDPGGRVDSRRGGVMAVADSAWHGLLAVDKPAGVTSHDVVLRVRRRLAARGAGHLGTLDPGASGLLVIALGAATRAVPVWQGGEKTYEGTIRFGIETDSQDLDGTVIAERPLGALDEAQVRAGVAPFTGTIAQIPPMVSALKVGGRRLHALARRGVEVERAPRTVTIHAWEWLAIELPEARFRIRCSGGTYVRTLAHDLGRALGPGAALASLRRTRSEPFELERAVTTAELDRLEPPQVLERFGIPLDRAREVLPAVVV